MVFKPCGHYLQKYFSLPVLPSLCLVNHAASYQKLHPLGLLLFWIHQFFGSSPQNFRIVWLIHYKNHPEVQACARPDFLDLDWDLVNSVSKVETETETFKNGINFWDWDWDFGFQSQILRLRLRLCYLGLKVWDWDWDQLSLKFWDWDWDFWVCAKTTFFSILKYDKTNQY